MLRFAIYISNHGFGHASRMAALAQELNNFGIWTEIRTNRPEFLFSELSQNYSHISVAELDFGVVHSEMLQTDLQGTKTALLSLLSRRAEIAEREIQFLRDERIDCVVADIPFLICEAASYTGVPVLAVSNFDWYYIYSELFATDLSMRPVLNTIYGLYSQVKLAYRLPFSDSISMKAFPRATTVGLLARKKDHYEDIRLKHSLDQALPIALSSHGGEGEIDLGLEAFLKVWPGYLISSSDSLLASNHLRIDKDADFMDYLKASDILITKPGYSSLAEATQLGKTILYRQRLNYPEERVLTAGLSSYPLAYDLGQKKLTKTGWNTLLSAALGSVKPKRRPVQFRNANADIAARMLADFLKVGKRGELISVFDLGSNNLNYCLFDASKEQSVHNVQLSVGLAKGMHDEILSDAAMNRAVRAIKQLSLYDYALDSRKHLIGTAACRRAKNLDVLLGKISGKTGLTLKLISAKDEADYAYLAARSHLKDNEQSLIVDIGGASTEFVWSKGTRKLRTQSLNIGLLELRKHGADIQSSVQHLKEALKGLAIVQVDKVIVVGLTGAFLLKVLSHSQRFLYLDDLVPISKIQLDNLLNTLAQNGFATYEAFLPEPQNKDILAISASLLREILDRFEQNQIMVCTDGIALGFARHIRNKMKRNT